MTAYCPCGKASIDYQVVGEDSWVALSVNTRIVKDEYVKACICKSCGTRYDEFDPAMVRVEKGGNQ